MEIEDETPPTGSVVILPDVLILGPAQSDMARSPDTAAKISAALQTMLNDPRNTWISTGVGITNITFKEGAANVTLEGDFLEQAMLYSLLLGNRFF